MPVVSVAGTDVHYSVSGAGPGLVLVHGSSMDAATNFGHMVQHFADLRTVITPDYAGSGETTAPPGELSLDLLTEQVLAATRAVTTEPVDLVGFSLGAAVAATVAARHPDLVRRLVLVAGWTHTEDPRLRLGFETWARVMDTDPELASAQGPLMAFSPRFLAQVGADGLALLRAGKAAPGTRRQVDLNLRVDIRRELPHVSAPTLVVGCTLDYLVPVENARAVHAAIPGSRYAELDSGHVVFAERPAELGALIRDFLLDEPVGNVALVRSFYDRIYAGDLDAALALLHEDFTWLVGTESEELAAAVPWAGRVLHGRGGFAELVEKLFGEFESLAFEARELYPVGDHVFVQGSFRFRHKVSGKTIESDWIARFDIADGKVRGGQFFENTFAVASARV